MSDSRHNKVNGKSVSKLDEWIKQAEKDGIVNDSNSRSTESEEEKAEMPNERNPTKEGPTPSKKEYRKYTDEEGYNWIETPRGLKFPQPTKLKKKGGSGWRKSRSIIDRFGEAYPLVEKWLENVTAKNTRISYTQGLLAFFIDCDISPLEFAGLWDSIEKQQKAKHLVGTYIQRIMKQDPFLAINVIRGTKHFFKFNTGFVLSLAVKVPEELSRKRERKRYAWGTTDDIREKMMMFLPTMSRDLRDLMALTMLYRCGFRDGVLNKLKVCHMQDRFEAKHPIKGEMTEVLCLTITEEVCEKTGHYKFPRLEDTPDQPRGYYTYLANDSLELFDKFMAKYHVNNPPDKLLFAKYEGQRFCMNLRKRSNHRLNKAGYDAHLIWCHQFRGLFERLAHEVLKENRAEYLGGHLLSGSQEHYQKRNKIECAKDYLKIQFTPSVEFLKRRFAEEMQLQKQREEEEVAKKLKEPGFKAEEPIKEETSMESKGPQTHVKVAKEITPEKREPTFVLGPAPKHCLRGLAFKDARDDSYCHHTCRISNSDEYKACQDLKNENPELFL